MGSLLCKKLDFFCNVSKYSSLTRSSYALLTFSISNCVSVSSCVCVLHNVSADIAHGFC